MINKHKSNKIKETSNTVRHLNNRTDHRHSKSRCDQSSPARRTIKHQWTSRHGWQGSWQVFLWKDPGFQIFSPRKSWWRYEMETFSALLAILRIIHRSPVDSPHKGQWHRALMFSVICSSTNGWANKRDTGDLRCHHTHYDITVMYWRVLP